MGCPAISPDLYHHTLLRVQVASQLSNFRSKQELSIKHGWTDFVQ